jgi:hypothetical protein
VNYYKLEAVQNALHLRGVKRISVGPEPRTEVWSRVVGEVRRLATLAWEHGEEIVSEEEFISVADALGFKDFGALIAVAKSWKDGGLRLGPTPPSRKP